jgi:hypothetical protein
MEQVSPHQSHILANLSRLHAGLDDRCKIIGRSASSICTCFTVPGCVDARAAEADRLRVAGKPGDRSFTAFVLACAVLSRSLLFVPPRHAPFARARFAASLGALL